MEKELNSHRGDAETRRTAGKNLTLIGGRSGDRA
jgi:hypothetical protein